MGVGSDHHDDRAVSCDLGRPEDLEGRVAFAGVVLLSVMSTPIARFLKVQRDLNPGDKVATAQARVFDGREEQ